MDKFLMIGCNIFYFTTTKIERIKRSFEQQLYKSFSFLFDSVYSFSKINKEPHFSASLVANLFQFIYNTPVCIDQPCYLPAANPFLFIILKVASCLPCTCPCRQIRPSRFYNIIYSLYLSFSYTTQISFLIGHVGFHPCASFNCSLLVFSKSNLLNPNTESPSFVRLYVF